jgi:hypothetical protein
VACLCSVRGSHRIGQTEPVTAWRIFPHARDARIAELIDSKAGLAAKALHASGEEVFSSADVQLEALVARCAAGVTYTMRRPGLLTCRNTGVSECPRGDLGTVKWEPSHRSLPGGRGAVRAASWTWSEYRGRRTRSQIRSDVAHRSAA